MQQINIARAQNSHNLDSSTDDFRHHDIDALIHVGAKASRLASLLLRIKNADQSRWTKEAVIILAQPLAGRYKISRSIAMRVAYAALTEWINPHCRACSGAREILREAGGSILCESCAGAGVHRYSDSDRASLCGAAFVGRIADAHAYVMSEITNNIAAALRD